MKLRTQRIINIVSASCAVIALIMFFSARSFVGGFGNLTFNFFPWLIAGLIVITTGFTLFFTLTDKAKFETSIIFLGWNGLQVIAGIVAAIILREHVRVFFAEMLSVIGIFFAIAVIVFMVFYFPKINYKSKKVKTIVAAVVCAGLVLTFLFTVTDFRELRFNFFTQNPVVYAVEDEYQIVWSTRSKGTGYVEVGGQKYYDTYSGALRSTETVHKVSVPQDVLDAAKSYTVCSRAMIYEQAYSALQGYTIRKTVSFRPVTSEDGIKYYVISDTHGYINAPAKAASYWKSDLDFLVLAGDSVSYMDSNLDGERILNLLGKITGGKIPVVYARGNHEAKGKYNESLHRYVGAKGEDFYYTFRLNSVWGIVLDLGADHSDDWREFFDNAKFDAYRERQIDFLDTVIENKDTQYAADDVKYRIAISHIPTAFVEYDETYLFDTLFKMNMRLNQMDIAAMFSGHFHRVYVAEPFNAGTPLSYTAAFDGKVDEKPEFIATGAEYRTVIVSRPALNQTSKYGFSHFVGAALEFNQDSLYLNFTNDKKEIISTVSAFEDKNYGKAVTLWQK